MKKPLYITVCKNVILSNLKNGTDKPAIRISEGKYGKPTHRKKLSLKNLRGIKVVTDMENPLPWGAKVWIEVEK